MAFFIPYPQPKPLLNEFQSTTSLPYRSPMALMPFLLLSISSPSLKSSYLARPRTPRPHSFNTISPTFSPTLASPELSSLTEELHSFQSSPRLYGNNSLSRRSPPPLIIHKQTARWNVPIKNLNNIFGSIATINRITGPRCCRSPNL